MKINKLKNLVVLSLCAIVLNSCSIFSGKKNGPSVPNDGQLHGIASGTRYTLPVQKGMVLIPQGSFVMGPSDEDPAYAFSNRNRTVSISGFWMDATEITNNEYRQFVKWTADSVIAKAMGYVTTGPNGEEIIDKTQMKNFNINDPATLETLGNTELIFIPDDRIFDKKEIDVTKIKFNSQRFDLKEAAKRENVGKPRSKFIIKSSVSVYPDTLCWIRDFAYSYNEPMAKRYFTHPSYGNYPVVGTTWKQANAFCEWRTKFLNDYLESKKRTQESDFRLPTEAQWEYAARGGRNESMYPWGNYYPRTKKGCLLANFKPGRGNYPEDGGFYTVQADSYWPNDWGLYCMSGNVAEWTSSIYYEGSINFQHDMNPDVRWDAKDTDPAMMKRKIIRGGSWKDVAYYIQVGTSTYEYQDSSKSYIGFRTVIDMPTQAPKSLKMNH